MSSAEPHFASLETIHRFLTPRPKRVHVHRRWAPENGLPLLKLSLHGAGRALAAPSPELHIRGGQSGRQEQSRVAETGESGTRPRQTGLGASRRIYACCPRLGTTAAAPGRLFT